MVTVSALTRVSATVRVLTTASATTVTGTVAGTITVVTAGGVGRGIGGSNVY